MLYCDHDINLINQIALLWVSNGGDILGFQMCYNDIINAIEDKIKENESGK